MLTPYIAALPLFFMCLNFQSGYTYNQERYHTHLHRMYTIYVYIRFLFAVIITFLYSTFPM